MDMFFAQLCSTEESFNSFNSWPYSTKFVTGNGARNDQPFSVMLNIDLLPVPF